MEKIEDGEVGVVTIAGMGGETIAEIIENAKSEAREVLNAGGAVGIFPEGTRNKTFGTKDEVDLLPFKYGAVKMAMETNAEIIPKMISTGFGLSVFYKEWAIR